MVLTTTFYQQNTIWVAKKLLGKILVHRSGEGLTSGKIVETEAYLHQGDQASHSASGKTARNQPMFDSPGKAYIYFVYGRYYCLNVVTNRKGVGEAVLIRALQPIQGINLMQKRRKLTNIYQLCNGPAKLVSAMGITPELNGQDLVKGTLWIEEGKQKVSASKIITSPRVGITKSVDLPFRFYLADNPFISKK